MSEELLQQMMGKLSSIETRIDSIESTMVTKDDIAELHTKFDNMASEFTRMITKLNSNYEQIAFNSRLAITIKGLTTSVNENTTDIKLLKKLVSSF